MRAHDLAAAAAQRMVLAARAWLLRIAPGAERTERVGRGPVGRECVDTWALAIEVRRWRCEAARGQPAIRLRADEEVAARAAVHRELGEQLAIGFVVREHRRV